MISVFAPYQTAHAISSRHYTECHLSHTIPYLSSLTAYLLQSCMCTIDTHIRACETDYPTYRILYGQRIVMHQDA